MSRHAVWCLLAIGLTCLASSALPAWGADVTLGAARGLGGAVRAGTWVPVTVDIEYTPGDPAAVLDAELRLGGSDGFEPIDFVLPLRLTPGRRRLQAYYHADLIPAGTLRVSLHESQTGRMRAETILPQPHGLFFDTEACLVAVLSEAGRIPPGRLVHDGARLPRPPGEREGSGLLLLSHPLHAVTIHPDAAPDAWIGWEGADVILWDDPDRMSLLPEQVEALEQWVWAGGRLLVAFSARREPIRPARLPSWLDIDISEPVNRPLGNVGGWVELPPDVMRMASGAWQYDFFRQQRRSNLLAPPRSPDPDAFRLPWRTLTRRGATEGESQDAPVFLCHPHGAGRVTVLAFDPGLWPFPSFEGLPALLARAAGTLLDTRDMDLILRQEPALRSIHGEVDLRHFHDAIPSGYPGTAPVTSDWLYLMTGAAVLRSPVAARVPLWWLLVFVGAYLACIGPVERGLLRRWGRLHLTWVTFPASLVMFSCVAYFGARYVHDHRSTARVYGMEDSVAGSPRRLRQELTGIFSARNAIATLRGSPWIRPYPGFVPVSFSDSTWTVPPDSDTRPVERFFLTMPQRIEQAQLRQGMSRPIRSAGFSEAPPLVEGHLRYGKETGLQGEIRIRDGVTLERAMLFGRAGVYDIGTLEGGAVWTPEGKPHVPFLIALSEMLVRDRDTPDPAHHAMQNLRRLTFAALLHHWRRMEPLARMQREPPRWVDRMMDLPQGMPSLYGEGSRIPPVNPDAEVYPPLVYGYGIDALWQAQGVSGIAEDRSRVLLAGGWLLLAEEARIPEGVEAEGWLLEREGRVLHRILFPPPAEGEGGHPPLWGDPFYDRRSGSAP